METKEETNKNDKNTYEVICTTIYNGSVEVEASSEEEAMEIARQMLEENKVDFEFGETTVDYANLIHSN